jgi:hypothetical protein
MAARTAVVAGTATAVSGRVHRRQSERWQQQEDAQAYQEQQAYQQPQYQQPPAAAPEEDATAQLQKLAQLHAQGVLTDEEFAASKAKILGI